jgi:hypothetical protein
MSKLDKDVVEKPQIMSMGKLWTLAEKKIWPKSKRKCATRKSCSKCESDAMVFKSPIKRRNGKAPLLPFDFEEICPQYMGKCPRCGGALHDTVGF